MNAIKATLSTLLCLTLGAGGLGAQSVWKRYFIGTSGASVELPKQPQSADVRLSDSIRSQLAQLDASRVDAGDLVVLLTFSVYKSKATNLDGSVSGAIAQMKRGPNRTGLTASSSKLKVAGKDARLLKLKFVSSGKPISYAQLFVGDGKKLWQVVVGYPASNKSGPAVVARIFGSIKFQ